MLKYSNAAKPARDGLFIVGKRQHCAFLLGKVLERFFQNDELESMFLV